MTGSMVSFWCAIMVQASAVSLLGVVVLSRAVVVDSSMGKSDK